MTVFAAVAPAAAQSGHVTVVVRPDLQTGKLIRSVVVKPREVGATSKQGENVAHEPLKAVLSPAALSTNLIEMIDQIARAYSVEASLVHSVIRAESNYNALAMSNKGAQGMMQLIPATARRFGVQNPFDAKQNVEGGVRYLRFLLDYYKNDYPKAIAAYNAGEGAVDRYQGIPPYSETIHYVYQVAKNLKAARQAEESRLKSAQAAVKAAGTPKSTDASDPENQEETHHSIRASLGEDGRVIYRTQ